MQRQESKAAKLIKTRMRAGVWEGVLIGAGDAPEIHVWHLGEPIAGATLTAMEGGNWALQVPIPVETLCDGVQTFLIFDAASDEKLGHFALVSGDALEDDIRAEVDLLRAELDMLKRTFRQHCLSATV
ncbi:hypothetical protein EOK75_11010 [Pseudorhodobacter turbinis]|uniref:Uncharacterized protein n=1 Tax=Pseudorhodobacter turbinis TaxID=2500533 RepID=A0A4P8EGD2_9RHOB|nr:hypothetical protein [Pseudorhodobacter turbinis]QCO56211.1 hypothetical protein EOK75_11010 [Pseudorhodobacter turbinis]